VSSIEARVSSPRSPIEDRWPIRGVGPFPRTGTAPASSGPEVRLRIVFDLAWCALPFRADDGGAWAVDPRGVVVERAADGSWWAATDPASGAEAWFSPDGDPCADPPDPDAEPPDPEAELAREADPPEPDADPPQPDADPPQPDVDPPILLSGR
jgi:hypothetical protein